MLTYFNCSYRKKQSNNRMEKAIKTITKIIHINDGNDVTAHNGDRLFVETSLRAETIISAFLTDGWTLHSRVFRVTPSTSSGNITLYLSGWDFLFTKEIPDAAIDESDTLLNDAISVALSIGNENSFEEDMDYNMLV